LGLIGENSNNLTDLIDDVLDFSQIEAGKLTSHLQLVDIKKYTEAIGTGFARDCEVADITLNFKTELKNSNRVVIDKVKTQTMLNNLIDNAVKYSHHGGTVEVVISENNKQLKIEVKDQGIGIPESFKNKLFSPFEQVDNSRTRNYGGTGLGLSIVHKFALFLGGSINIDSTEGQGTVCTLLLPIREADVESNSNIMPEHKNDVVDFKFNGEKILVVEDSVVNQQLMTACLQNYGLTVDIAENGLIGIEKAQSWLPDLVLMDMHMPKMDGLEATEKLRKIADVKDIPVFGLSADVHKEYIEKAIECGIDEYLTKPVDFNQLCSLLAKYLKKSKYLKQSKNLEQSTEVNNENKASTMSESVLNVEKGISYAANNSDLFKQLLATFIKQYDQSAEQLEQFNKEGQYDEAMKLAHTMKGVCSTLGMDKISDIAKKMQFAFGNEKLDGVAEMINDYSKLLAQAIIEASEYCAQ
jgi:CheY-like chemotaxis protein/HPt (histidine-containing phosphotransfer) domain-containing protein/two-component sensor histidine kinase